MTKENQHSQKKTCPTATLFTTNLFIHHKSHMGGPGIALGPLD